MAWYRCGGNLKSDFYFISDIHNTYKNRGTRTGSYVMNEYDEEYLLISNIRTDGGDTISHTVTSDDTNAEITPIFNEVHSLDSRTRMSLWKIKSSIGSTISFSATGNYSVWNATRFKAKNFIEQVANTSTSTRTGSYINKYKTEYMFLTNYRTAGVDTISHTVTSDDTDAKITPIFNFCPDERDSTNGYLRVSLWKIVSKPNSTISFSATGNYSAWRYCRMY